jgi:hypothetical protein
MDPNQLRRKEISDSVEEVGVQFLIFILRCADLHWEIIPQRTQALATTIVHLFALIHGHFQDVEQALLHPSLRTTTWDQLIVNNHQCIVRHREVINHFRNYWFNSVILNLTRLQRRQRLRSRTRHLNYIVTCAQLAYNQAESYRQTLIRTQ